MSLDLVRKVGRIELEIDTKKPRFSAWLPHSLSIWINGQNIEGHALTTMVRNRAPKKTQPEALSIPYCPFEKNARDGDILRVVHIKTVQGTLK